MKLNKSAFTLAELLVALAVIGILIAILMPLIMNIMPNQKVVMAKRAHYTVETAVSNLLNDSACYPDEDDRVGLANGWGYADCDLWGGTSNQGTITTEGDAGTKFFTLFREQLQFDPNNQGNPNDNPIRFATKDGMRWAIQNNNGTFLIAVDVNGDERGGGADAGNNALLELAGNCQSDCDVAAFQVASNGDVTPLGSWTTQAINVNKKINSD